METRPISSTCQQDSFLRHLAEIKLGKGMTGFSMPLADSQSVKDICLKTKIMKHTASHCTVFPVTFCRFVHDSRAPLEFETLCRSQNKVIWSLGDAFLSLSSSPSCMILQWTQVQTISPPAIQTRCFDSPPILQEITMHNCEAS